MNQHEFDIPPQETLPEFISQSAILARQMVDLLYDGATESEIRAYFFPMEGKTKFELDIYRIFTGSYLDHHPNIPQTNMYAVQAMPLLKEIRDGIMAELERRKLKASVRRKGNEPVKSIKQSKGRL